MVNTEMNKTEDVNVNDCSESISEQLSTVLLVSDDLPHQVKDAIPEDHIRHTITHSMNFNIKYDIPDKSWWNPDILIM